MSQDPTGDASEDAGGRSGDGSSGDDSTPRSKVARVMRSYALAELGDELERRWLGEGAEEQSLRDLAEWFNTQILSEAFEQAGEPPVSGEANNLYHLLTDDDVRAADRTRARQKLEQAGIDAEAILDDFVTYNAIYSYLTKVRGVSKSRETGDPVERGRDRVQRLQSRLRRVTGDMVESLQSAEHIAETDVDVLVSVTVVCEACGTYHDIDEYLEAAGCECGAT
jgi:hypothetical protein